MGIRAKLVLYTTAIILGVIALLTLWNVKTERDTIRAASLRKVETLTGSLARELDEDILQLRVHKIRIALARVLSHQEMTYACALDGEGRVISDGTEASSKRGTLPDNEIVRRLLAGEPAVSAIMDSDLVMGRMLQTTSGEPIGYIVAAISLAAENEQIRQAIIAATILGSILLGLGILTATILAGSFSRPITELAQVTQDIREGRREVPVAVSRKDELGSLAASFDAMLRTLTEKERELQELNWSLENRVKRRTLALDRSNRDLQQFANATSHDLQEPLRMVSSYLQLLRRDYRDKLDEKGDRFIGYAMDGAKRMRDMIGALLDYARVDSLGGTMQLTRCEQIFNTVLGNLKVAIEESGARITHNPLPAVVGNEVQITRLLQNLLANAIRYSGDEPSRIHVSATKKDGDWLFSVADNGRGVEPQHADQIFELFARVDHGPAGTGIGLSVCRRIVELHGGKIWVESQPGEGSTFYFTLRGDAGRVHDSVAAALAVEREKARTTGRDS